MGTRSRMAMRRILLRRLLSFKRQRGRVDAIALAGGLGAIGEDVSEVGAAGGAGGFDAPHAESPVFMLFDGVRGDGVVEAGPAAAGVELGLRLEQRSIAGGAVVQAIGVVVGQGAGEGTLRALFAHHVVLLRRELGAPFGVSL